MTWTSFVLDVTKSLDYASETKRPAEPIQDRNSSPPLTRGQAAANSLPKIRVIMVAWDCCDENVMTSLTNYTIKVWNSQTKTLVSVLKVQLDLYLIGFNILRYILESSVFTFTIQAHTDEAYCLEPHPTDKRIFLSAGHDGNVFLWDVTCGKIIMNFYNMVREFDILFVVPLSTFLDVE